MCYVVVRLIKMTNRGDCIKELRNEMLRMEMAYDNLFTDSDLYRTYKEIETKIRNINNETQNTTAAGENVICFGSKGR